MAVLFRFLMMACAALLATAGMAVAFFGGLSARLATKGVLFEGLFGKPHRYYTVVWLLISAMAFTLAGIQYRKAEEDADTLLLQKLKQLVSGVFRNTYVLIYVCIALVMASLLSFWYAPDLTGDEAAFFMDNVQYGPLMSLAYQSNHPMYLWLCSLLYAAGFSPELALRLPAWLFLMVGMGGVSGFLYLRSGNPAVPVFAGLAFLFMPWMLSYGWYGKSYLPAAIIWLYLAYVLHRRQTSGSGFFSVASGVFFALWMSPSMLFPVIALGIVFFPWKNSASVWLSSLLPVLAGAGFAIFILGPSWILVADNYFHNGVVGNFEPVTEDGWPGAVLKSISGICIQTSPAWLSTSQGIPEIVSGACVLIGGGLIFVVKEIHPAFRKMFLAAWLSWLMTLSTGYLPPERFFLFLSLLSCICLAWLAARWFSLRSATLAAFLLVLVSVLLSFQTRNRFHQYSARHRLDIEQAALAIPSLPAGHTLYFHHWNDISLLELACKEHAVSIPFIQYSEAREPGLHFMECGLKENDGIARWQGAELCWVEYGNAPELPVHK